MRVKNITSVLNAAAASSDTELDAARSSAEAGQDPSKLVVPGRIISFTRGASSLVLLLLNPFSGLVLSSALK